MMTRRIQVRRRDSTCRPPGYTTAASARQNAAARTSAQSRQTTATTIEKVKQTTAMSAPERTARNRSTARGAGRCVCAAVN